MDSKKIFEEKNKLYENIDKELEDSYNQRIENKLSLRKQKINDIINKKRIYVYNLDLKNNGFKSKWKLIYDLSKIKFPQEPPNKYKLNFSDDEDEEILTTSLKYLKSENIIEVKYSIVLIQIFINKHMKNDLTNYINLLFIYELFGVIKKYINDKEIVFNILHILSNYSYFNTDNNLSTILLSPNAYKTWELCFDLQDYEIFYEIIYILNNIIFYNQIGSCNLIRSSLILNNIYNFYMNQTIISKINNKDKNDIINDIINEGILLFCNLLIVSIDKLDRLTIEEIYSSKQKIINVLICYSNSDIFNQYQMCLYSICLSIEKDIRLVDELEKNNFIHNILHNNKFNKEQIILNYINKILGNYIAYKNKINHNLLVDILQFEIEYLKICDTSSFRKEIFWALSNLLLTDKTLVEEICNNNEFLKKMIYCYNYSFNYSEIKEITYFFSLLISNINNVNQFIKIQENHLLEITIDHAKNSVENNVEALYLVLELLDIFFNYGEYMSKYYEGKNLIIDRFNKLGGRELLEKYTNYPNENICKEINVILKKYYFKNI